LAINGDGMSVNISRRDVSLGTVSVVMMPHRPSISQRRTNAAGKSAIPETGSGSPITPVENGNTACAPPASADSNTQHPGIMDTPKPVPALALPVLTSEVRRCMARCSRATVTVRRKSIVGKTAAKMDPAADSCDQS
jgi:hypothetical protein